MCKALRHKINAKDHLQVRKVKLFPVSLAMASIREGLYGALHFPFSRPISCRGPGWGHPSCNESMASTAEARPLLPLGPGTGIHSSVSAGKGLKFLFLLDSLQIETTKAMEACNLLWMVWMKTTRPGNSSTLQKGCFVFHVPGSIWPMPPVTNSEQHWVWCML